MEDSPFGKYKDGLAAIVALSIIFSWLVGLLLNSSGVPQQLDNAAWIALGYIFGRPQQAAAGVATIAKAVQEKANGNGDAKPL